MQKFLFVKVDKKFVKLNCVDIIYIEAVKNYIRIVTVEKIYLLLLNIHQIEKVLTKNQFCRVHRSYIVSIDRVMSFDADFVYLKDKKIPISRHYRNALYESVVVLDSKLNRPRKISEVNIDELINIPG